MNRQCPVCSEHDIDRLVWIDDERVKCLRCGTIFPPTTSERISASPSPETTERDQALEAIAREALMIDTLETRRSGEDFHEVAVWSVLAALRRAFSAGYERAVDDHALPEDEFALGGEAPPARLRCPACGREIEIRPIQ